VQCRQIKEIKQRADEVEELGIKHFFANKVRWMVAAAFFMVVGSVVTIMAKRFLD